jgi:phosphatidylserine decarboxylase
MLKLKDWISSEEVQNIRKMSWKDILEKEFNRNPIRPIHYRSNVLYSPNDGVILHSKIVKPDDEYLNIKGRKLTLRQILQDPKYSEESLAIGIFLTVYDMHYSKMPTDGLIKCLWKEVEGVSSGMFNLEKLITRKGEIDSNLEEYLFTNERWIFEIQNIRHGFKYYIVQIADTDVNIILPYIKNKWTYKMQGETFSFVTYGSHTEIIIPVKYNPVYLVPRDDVYHVTTSDKLVEFGEYSICKKKK